MSASSANLPTPADVGNISQDMHVINLTPLKSSTESIGLPARTITTTTTGQQHLMASAVGQPLTRVLTSSGQPIAGTSLPVAMPASNLVVIGADNLTPHKQVNIGLPAVTTITTASTTPLVGRPVTTTLPLSVTPSHIPVSTTYHVPRGAAAVANISAPRSSVATPIVRVTPNLQSTGITTVPHPTSYMPGTRAMGPRTLTPVVGTTCLARLSSSTIQPASGIPRATVFTQIRPNSMTAVNARPVGIQINKLQAEPSKQQVLHSPGQKSIPIQHTTTPSQVQMPDKGYLKTMSVAHLVPARGPSLTYTNPLMSTHQLVQATNQTAARQAGVPTASTRHVAPSRLAVLTQGITTAIPGAIVAVSTAPCLATLHNNTLLSPVQNTTVLSAATTRGAILTGHTRLAVAQTGSRVGVTNPTVIATMGTAANTVINSPARLTSPGAAAHQNTLLAAQTTRLTMAAGVPTVSLQTAGLVSIQPVVVATNSNPILSIKTSGHPQLSAPLHRVLATQQGLGTKVITQAAHGPSLQLTQVPSNSFTSKMPQTMHGVVPLQQATLAITTVPNRPAHFTTSSSLSLSNIRPVTVATTTTRVFSQQPGGEISLPVHTIQAQQSQQQPPPSQLAPTQPQHLLQAAPAGNSVYFYESTSYPVAGIASSIVTRPFPTAPNSFPPQNPAIQGHQVHGATTTIMTSGPPVRFNPVMVMDSARSTTMPVQSYLAEASALSLTDSATIPASPNHLQTLTKPNASPRPSILRKRDIEGSPMKAQKNLTPVLVAMGGGPPSPPSPRRPDSRGNGSSNGSTTISATSSPGLGEVGDDSQPSSVKLETIEEGERPPVEMSPRKKPRKQQLTGNELHEPKFSEDDMEFILDDKVRRDISEVSEEFRDRVFVPKRPKVSLKNSYRHTWKSQHNHFIHYDNVKAKDSRPTVSDLANQKGIMEKLNGWKIFHLSTQMEELSELETSVVERLTSTLKVTEVKGGKDVDKDNNRINELIKGNIQRSKVIKDQMQEAVSQMMKIFDHKEHVTDILVRSANKRTLKKREKM